MVVLSSIQLLIYNLGGTCLDVVALVFTCDLDDILSKRFWVVNEVVWVIMVYVHET